MNRLSIKDPLRHDAGNEFSSPRRDALMDKWRTTLTL